MPAIQCCVPTCWKSQESKHRFPDPEKYKERFDKWINLAGNKNLVGEDAQKVYRNARVCSFHFTTEDFGPNRKLKPDVLPSLDLPEPLQFPELESLPSTSSMPFDVPILMDEPSTSSPQAPWQIPKRRSSLLAEVNTSKMQDLTAKAKHFVECARPFRKSAVRSNKMRALIEEQIQLTKRATHTGMIEEAVSSMDRVRRRFFHSKLENVAKKPKRRRYSLEDKVLALALHKQSGFGYRFLSKVFTLPSRKSLGCLLNRIPVKPGLHFEIFSVLKAEVRNFKNPLDHHCILMFGEMSIQLHLRPNIRQGCIDGFENFGFTKTEKIANHVQVFMLRGIRRKWKLPVFYNFVNGVPTKTIIALIIKEIITKSHDIGLNIIATVCDQGANNRAAINLLVRQTRENYIRNGLEMEEYQFEIDGKRIIPLYDVPHLFKGVRNNFLKYNIHFQEDGKEKLAKWEHIFTTYKMDPYIGSLRMLPNITDSHVNPQKINKMEVSKCTQVFSHTVAVAIDTLAFTGITIETGDEALSLEKNASDTALLLSFLDKLFDSLNGSSFKPRPGKNLRCIANKRSEHILFWSEALSKLKNFRFIKEGKFCQSSSLTNLTKTLRNFRTLFETLSDLGFKYIAPRIFSQGPLENFFRKNRQRGCRNINPTLLDFTAYYKNLLIDGFTSNHSVGANCENDKSEIFLTLQRLVTQGFPEEKEQPPKEVFHKVPLIFPSVTKSIEPKVLKYVLRYILKHVEKHQLCNCINSFYVRKPEHGKQWDEFIKFKKSGKVQSLKYVQANFLNRIKLAVAIIKYIFNRDIAKNNVLKHALNILKNRISLTDCFHDEKIKTDIFKYIIKIISFNYCTQLNRAMKGLDLRKIPENAPVVFKHAKNIHAKICKRRKF